MKQGHKSNQGNRDGEHRAQTDGEDERKSFPDTLWTRRAQVIHDATCLEERAHLPRVTVDNSPEREKRTWVR